MALLKGRRTGNLRSVLCVIAGNHLMSPQQRYFKAKAYRLTPHAIDGHFALDGEKYPYTPFHVEIHHRLGTTLGHGAWCPEFC